MQHFTHFRSFEANFALSAEQKKTADSLNYLRQNDPEEFNRVNQAGKQAARKNKQTIENRLSGQALNATNQNVAAGMSSEQARQMGVQQANQNRSSVVKDVNKNYNENFVKSTNANQAAGTRGKIANTAKRWGGKVAGLGGLAMTGMYVLPTIASMLPQKPQPEQEPPY